MTTWNNTAPAVGNQITADIPDITENFAHLKSGFVRIFQDTWSDSDLTDDKIDTTVGFNDGTYNYEFPTNNIDAHAKIMIGDANTVLWMYVTAANGCQGWKVQSSGGGNLLAIGYAAAQYDSTNDGSASSGGWARGDCTLTAAQSGVPAHTHTIPGRTTTQDAAAAYVQSVNNAGTSTNITSAANAAANAASAHNHANTWRPTANVGRLYKLDEA